MMLESVDPTLISWMIREKRRDLPGTRVVEVLKQPDEPPGFVPAAAHKSDPVKSARDFDVARIAQRVKLAEQRDREHVRASRSEQNRGAHLSLLDALLLLEQRDRVVMDGMGHFMGESPGELLPVLDGSRAGRRRRRCFRPGGEGVGLSLMNDIDLEGMVVSRLRCPKDRIDDCGAARRTAARTRRSRPGPLAR
jgi:hypothetical protein